MRSRSTRMALVGLCVIGLAAGTAFAGPLTIHTETFQALAPTPAFQLFPGPPSSAIFTNLSGQEVVGLKIIFSVPVPSATGYGMGASAAVTSNEGQTLTFGGTIGSFGGVYAQWKEDAQILAASWFTEDGSAIPIDLHQPFARMTGSASYRFAHILSFGPQTGIVLAQYGYFAGQIVATFVLDGGLSAVYDGSEVARYQWEWNDGVIQNGPTAERTMLITMDLGDVFGQTSYYVGSVTLTVWSVNGSSSSVTKTFLLRVFAIA